MVEEMKLLRKSFKGFTGKRSGVVRKKKKKSINPSLESLNEILDFMVKDMESETNLGHPPILL